MIAYPALERLFRRRSLIAEAAAHLHWDHAVMMPRGGAPARAEQLATLRTIGHDMLAQAATADLLEQAEAEAAALDPWQAANLRHMRRAWRQATALSAELVEALSKACSEAEMVWREARPANDFGRQRPHLEAVLALTRERAGRLGEAFGLTPYDALLDQFDPGCRAAEIDPIFADLAQFLPPVLAAVLATQDRAPAPVRPEGPFPIAAQRRLAEDLMAAIGFDFDHGRLDVSAHPFTGGVPDDVRVTTRFDEADFTSGLMAVLHETGHALYERGLPAAWRHQPVGGSAGMTLHESQSLLLEMQICRGPDFLAFAAPRMRATFGARGPAWAAANLARLTLRVRPGLIRVDADEVTYPLHIILRTRLERALLAGDLRVADLPGAWADGMRDLLGVAPPDDRDGCLQDIHWIVGLIGYFPTYTLGALAAAQLHGAVAAREPELPARIAEGDFRPLLDWLAENIHGLGARHERPQVIERATGAPLASTAFKAHIRARYLAPAA